ncbi:hypothetical protein C8F04DRAFT_1061524 [Mycena alexandri]|uniref:Uncharacterized protein n=1 Tax=Mycena alexandri TaxID=1745969 RepID=A0AAD6TJH7_9AGAR|nr:hypothetical protein C8F04DRAFT_1061524 [Mycena alexandri]
MSSGEIQDSESPREPQTDEQRVDDEGPREHEEPADSFLDAPLEPAGRSERSVSPLLPQIPGAALDLDLDLDSILSAANPDPESDKVKKRASNVLKLSQENEKLKAELKAMTDRLEAAEKRREMLARKQQQTMEPPSS